MGPDTNLKIVSGEGIVQDQGQRKPQVLGFQETEVGGHSQVLVLRHPLKTLVLQDNDWRYTRPSHQFLIIQLSEQRGESLKDPLPLPLHLPTLKPQSHHNKHCPGEEFCNSPSDFQGQRPRAV